MRLMNYLRITRKNSSELIEMRVNSLPPSLFSFLMILQGGKSSILRRRIGDSWNLQGVIGGGWTAETLLLLKQRMIREVMTRSTGIAEVFDAVLGKKAVEFRVFRLHHDDDDDDNVVLTEWKWEDWKCKWECFFNAFGGWVFDLSLGVFICGEKLVPLSKVGPRKFIKY